MATQRFMFMQKRVTWLRNAMLPSRFSPTGLYSDRIHQRTAAFRLLVHAEFESYLEDAVLSHVHARCALWRANRTPSITLAALVAYDEIEGRPPTSILNPPQKPSKLFEERLQEALTRFNSRVRNVNHGVREMNVLRMVLPAGMDASTLDTTWLATLDAWAQERGDLAHQSSGKVGLKLDPGREYATAKSLVGGFKTLDGQITKLP